MTAMEIVDSQLHEFAPWLAPSSDEPDERYRMATELALAAMDAVGVDAAVISSADAFCEYAGLAAPARLASIVSVMDPAEAGVEEVVAGVRSRPNVLGIRVVVGTADERVEMLKAGAFDPVFASAARADVPVCFFISGDLPLVHDVVRKHPDLNLVIDHLGLRQAPLQAADEPPFRRVGELIDLARYENVSVKLSGAPTLSREPFPFHDLWQHLMPVVEAFTPDRLMWGTDITRVHGRFPHRQHGIAPDWPAYPGKHTYAEAVMFLQVTDRLSSDDKEKMFSRTLRRIMRWPASQPSS